MGERDERLYLSDIVDAPWRKIAGTRDRMVHGYFNVSLPIVWEIVAHELPTLRGQVAAALGREGGQQGGA